MNDDLAGRLATVRSSVQDAAREAGRDASGITTIVVTKFHPAGLIRSLHDLGVRDFGESRHQEARRKADETSDLDLTWHFVGQLQSNKARAVRAYADVLHSVDRPSLLTALDDPGAEPEDSIGCFLQLNLTDDPGRGGAREDEVEALAGRILETAGLRLLGVMAVAPLGEDPRRAFERVRRLSQRVQGVAPGATAISAGMSHDFREAILEGATHLRIGTAITGKRPDRP